VLLSFLTLSSLFPSFHFLSFLIQFYLLSKLQVWLVLVPPQVSSRLPILFSFGILELSFILPFSVSPIPF